MNNRTAHIQLGGIVAAWLGLLTVDSPLTSYNIPVRLNVALAALLAALSVVWAVRGTVLFAAMRLGRAIEKEAAALPRVPRRAA